MMVTSTEFKTNLGHYLDIVSHEDIIITRNGRKVARLVQEEEDTLSAIRSLRGIIGSSSLANASDDDIKNILGEERLKRYDSID
jgi:prevent-host-death family protein